MVEPIRIAVTGAAGNIAYSVLFRLALGKIFGESPIHLKLLEIPQAMSALEGVAMELDDSACPALAKVDITDSAETAFDGVDWALLIGSRPRGPGMERADLIKINGPIFVGQGKALNRAAKNVRVAVVGNPCNTNCLIAMNNSDIPEDRFGAMMRLDQNRAQGMLAAKAGVHVSKVSNVVIWGNHSNNQYPDFENARIDGKKVRKVIKDEAWLQNTFVPAVQQRGAVVIKARGASSAASAANALLDHVRSFTKATPDNEMFSAAVRSKGEYGVDPGLIFGYPVHMGPHGTWKVVEGLRMSDWAKAKFDFVLDELRQERETVKDLLRS